MADLEKRAAERTLRNISDSQKIHVLEIFIAAIDGYKSSLDRVIQTRNLRNNYVNNIRNFSNFVTSGYCLHQDYINTIVSKQPAQTFLYILSCTVNIYPCLYRMESVASEVSISSFRMTI